MGLRASAAHVLTVLVILLMSPLAHAQTDLRVTGPQSGFPVAIPRLCDGGDAAEQATTIPDVIARDLQISGLFSVLNPSSYVETPGKCGDLDNVAFSDWTVIGAEGLVKGMVKEASGGSLEVTMYLYDVVRAQPVIGKRYRGESGDIRSIAHRFANEIVRYFTGEPGIFDTKFAYVSRIGRFKELFVMDIDGQNVRQLTRDRGLAISPSWSPEADRIVYTSYRTRQPELYIISPNGGNATQITRRDGLELGAKFAPDGRRLLASATTDGSSNLVFFDLRGRLLHSLTQGSAIDVSPSWSPDGNEVAFCSNRGGGPQIYVMGASGGRARRLSFTNSSYCTSPAWSPKGDKIAFVCRKSNGNQLFLSNVDGTQVSQLTFAGNNEDPAWSPDGRYLAYSTDAGTGGGRNIVISSLLGGSPVQITFSKSEDSQPAWSPRLE